MYRRRKYGGRLRRTYRRSTGGLPVRSVRKQLFSRSVRRITRNDAETKFNLVQLNLTVFNNRLWFLSTFGQGLAQGTTEVTRLGSKITVQTLSFDYTVVFNQNAGELVSIPNVFAVRCMVLYPRKGLDNNYLTQANVLNQNLPGVYNRPDPSRFFVLYDSRKYVKAKLNDPNDNYGAVHYYVNFKFNKKFPYIFNYDAAAIDNSVRKQPLIYMTCPLVAANVVLSNLAVSGYTCMSFKDM